MAKYMKITLEKRGISCIARLLEEDAPRTCAAIWEALPQGGPVYHAKYARNEIYSIVPRFAQTEPGIENPTVTPIPGDLCYFSFPSGMLDRQFKEEKGIQQLPGVIDLALFYGRNNLLLNADVGWVVGNVFPLAQRRRRLGRRQRLRHRGRRPRGYSEGGQRYLALWIS